MRSREGVGGRGKCTICDSAQADAITQALVAKEPLAKLAKKYSVTERSLRRHGKARVPPAWPVARRQGNAKGAPPAVSRVEGYVAKLEAVVAAAEQAKNVGQVLAAIRDLRPLVELLAKMTGEL